MRWGRERERKKSDDVVIAKDVQNDIQWEHNDTHMQSIYILL